MRPKIIQSNRDEILLGAWLGQTKPLPHILVRRTEKSGWILHKTQPYLAPQNNAPAILKLIQKDVVKSKNWKTGTVWVCAETSNTRVTRKPDNPLKGILNLAPNRTHNQYLCKLVVLTFMWNINMSSQPFSRTTNPRGTRKLDNPLKGIRNLIPQDPHNHLKGIWDLVQNRTRSQWARGLTIPI